MFITNKKKAHLKRIPAHGGEGNIDIWFFHQELQKYKDRDYPKKYERYKQSNWNFFAYAELGEGSTIAKHYHKGNDEIYYVLEGSATMSIDGESKRIKQNDVIVTLSGSWHMVDRVTKKLKFIAVEINIKK